MTWTSTTSSSWNLVSHALNACTLSCLLSSVVIPFREACRNWSYSALAYSRHVRGASEIRNSDLSYIYSRVKLTCKAGSDPTGASRTLKATDDLVDLKLSFNPWISALITSQSNPRLVRIKVYVTEFSLVCYIMDIVDHSESVDQ